MPRSQGRGHLVCGCIGQHSRAGRKVFSNSAEIRARSHSSARGDSGSAINCIEVRSTKVV